MGEVELNLKDIEMLELIENVLCVEIIDIDMCILVLIVNCFKYRSVNGVLRIIVMI